MAQIHKDRSTLLAELGDVTDVKVGKRYVHYKSPDKSYTVIALAFTEHINELSAVYRADYDPDLIFIRPLNVWRQTVEWQDQQVPRFQARA